MRIKFLVPLFAALAIATGAFAGQPPNSSSAPIVGTPGQCLIAGTNGVPKGSAIGCGTYSAQAPCDIFAANSLTCEAAYSVTRRLFNVYTGPLFQAQRASDGQLGYAYTFATGGVDIIPLLSFCANTTCYISNIYDQTPNRNDITPPSLINANPSPLSLTSAQGALALPVVDLTNGQSYNNLSAVNVPTGTNSLTEYDVINTARYSNCCGGFGDNETAYGGADGNLFLLAFGTGAEGAGCGPSTPNVGVDWENGVYCAGPTPTTQLITSLAKYNQGAVTWTLKDGNAAAGGLSTLFSGAPPSGYTANWQGAVCLDFCGSGGNASAPMYFYEGVIVAGASTDTVDNLIQTNITNFYSQYGGGNAIETPAAANQLSYPNLFTNSAWTKSGTFSLNSTAGPDGITPSWTYTAASNYQYVKETIPGGIPSGQLEKCGVYTKQGTISGTGTAVVEYSDAANSNSVSYLYDPANPTGGSTNSSGSGAHKLAGADNLGNGWSFVWVQGSTAQTAMQIWFGNFNTTGTILYGPAKCIPAQSVLSALSVSNSYVSTAPLAADLVYIKTAATPANGAITIAHQPDYPRKLQVNIVLGVPGTTNITAGTLTLVGTNCQGQAATEIDSLITAASVTITSTNCYSHLTSGTVAAYAASGAGTGNTLGIGQAAALGLPLQAGFSGLSIFKENEGNADETVGTIDTVNGTISPTTVPNGSNNYQFWYSYIP